MTNATKTKLPTLQEAMKAFYHPGSVFVPSFDFRPILFEENRTGVKKIDVSVVSAQSDAEMILSQINQVVLETDHSKGDQNV